MGRATNCGACVTLGWPDDQGHDPRPAEAVTLLAFRPRWTFRPAGEVAQEPRDVL